jgi:hypothetical protein
MYATAQPRTARSFFTDRRTGLRRMKITHAAMLMVFMFPAAGALAQQAPPLSQAAQQPLQREAAKPFSAAPAQQAEVSTAVHPDWPVNEKPGPANVVWDSHGLRIDASNSSLEQILKDVSTDTGAKVEGLHTDERIFGTYGPGTAREVLSQILDGSGYNVLMIGDQGQGTPRQIVLSERSAGPVTTSNNSRPTNNNEEDLEAEQEIREQEQQQQQLQQQLLEQQNIRNNPQPNATQPPGQLPRTPQQIMQQMQEQQQQQQMQQIQNQPR